MNVLVIGKAKTGTTVISKVIANSLSGPVNYFMEPKDLAFFQTPAGGAADEQQTNHMVKIIFEHWERRNSLLSQVVNNQCPFQFDKVIFIVRDLRDEIISRMLYYAYAICHHQPDYAKVHEWIQVLQQKETHPGAVSCLHIAKELGRIFHFDGEDIIHGSIGQTEVYTRFISRVQRPYLMIRYEDFMRGEIRELEDYLGIGAIQSLGSEHAAPGEDNTLNIVKRSASFDNWKTFFTEEDIIYLKPKVDDMMKKIGYADWALTPADNLESAHYSGYIKRIFNL